MNIIKFRIDGPAVPQGRPRATTVNGKVRMYDPPKSREYKQAVATIARAYMSRNQFKPYTRALDVKLEFFFAPPKSYSKKRLKAIDSKQELYTKRPDTDNLAKTVTDALNGICYEDDAQIVIMNLSKQYADRAYTKITIKEIH